VRTDGSSGASRSVFEDVAHLAVLREDQRGVARFAEHFLEHVDEPLALAAIGRRWSCLRSAARGDRRLLEPRQAGEDQAAAADADGVLDAASMSAVIRSYIAACSA
jgi:hypothetical protein